MPSPSTLERKPFLTKQYEFAAHIRDPEGNPAPAGIEDRRMAIYRELFYNNVEGFVSSGFPVLRGITDDETWHEMVRDFFRHHYCHTPLFLEISQEFLEYLENERVGHPGDPPFLLELAHYEWVELALSISEDEINLTGVDPEGDLLEGVPVLSPLALPLSYQYEVHRIGPEYIPDGPGKQPTYIVVYRDSKDEVRFLEINPVTARLLHLLREGEDLTGRQALERIVQELHHPHPDNVIHGGLQTLEELQQRDIVLGTNLHVAA